MYKILVIEITIVLQILARVTNKTYEDLVKEKGELYKKVNEAIDESITALQKNNDTEVMLGLQYMRQLKKQLKEINGTDSSNKIARRSRPKFTLNVKELAHLLSQKNKSHQKQVSEEKKTNAIDTDRIELLERFAQWEKNWKLEIAKGNMKKNTKRDIINEICPRYGYSTDNSTVRKGTTREYPDTALETSLEEEEEEEEKIQTEDGKNEQDQAEDGKNGKDQAEDDKNRQDQTKKGKKKKEQTAQEKDEKKQKKKEKKEGKWNKGLRYPCCRKCCKASDMGCL